VLLPAERVSVALRELRHFAKMQPSATTFPRFFDVGSFCGTDRGAGA
jgi:hypothetical protein